MADEREEQQDRSTKAWEVAGVAIPAGLFIGMGVGWILGHLVPGLFIGLGVGMLIAAIIRLVVAK